MSVMEITQIPVGTSKEKIKLLPAFEGKRIQKVEIFKTTAMVTFEDIATDSAQQNKSLSLLLRTPVMTYDDLVALGIRR